MGRSRKEHLVRTAMRLFERNGFHATGIDKILEEAGVAKMTLYHHFKSKDELILAALLRRDEESREALIRQVSERARGPRQRLLALFDVLEGAVQEEEFQGCSFIKAAAEYAGPDDPIHAACAEHKRRITEYVLQLAAAAGAGNPDLLARQLVVLLQGAMVLAQMTGESTWAREARRAADVLLENAIVADGAPSAESAATPGAGVGLLSDGPVATSQRPKQRWAAWKKK